MSKPISTFFFGPVPHKISSNNSSYSAVIRAIDLDGAIEQFLSSNALPGEFAGRHHHTFIKGISIEGLSPCEVIQIYVKDDSKSPRKDPIVDLWARFKKLGANKVNWNTNNHSAVTACYYTLVSEVSVYDLAKIKSKLQNRFLLTDKGDSVDASPTISPIGQAFSHGALSQTRESISRQKVAMIHRKAEIQSVKNEMQEQIQKFDIVTNCMNAYQQGFAAPEVIVPGECGNSSDPYMVFSKLRYLDEEVGLLLNLLHFDFSSMGRLDEWLVETGAWRKLLPHPKCFLLTQITRDKRDYGNRFINAQFNQYNRVCHLWVRNGDNVIRFEYGENAPKELFPHHELNGIISSHVRNHLFASEFKLPESNFFRKKTRNQWQFDKDGYIATPYCEEDWFPTIEDWMNSKWYDDNVLEAISLDSEALSTSITKDRYPFVIFLQGIVDSGCLKEIPRGADLTRSEVVTKYFHLIDDSRWALVDNEPRDTIARLLSPDMLQKGDFILARGLPRRQSQQWTLLQINKISEKGIHVRYRSLKQRHDYYSDLPPRLQFNKNALASILKPADTEYLPWDKLAPDLIERLLDDHEWKRQNRWMVPVLAVWSKLHAEFPVAENDIIIDPPDKWFGC